MEELLLEAVLALHELDVIDEQYVVAAVDLLELGLRAVADGLDEFVEEGLAGDVPNLVRRVVVVDVMADGSQQVGLSEPGCTVDEQRVVGPGRSLGHGQGSSLREAVGGSSDELLECQPGIGTGLRVRGDDLGIGSWFSPLVLGGGQPLAVVGPVGVNLDADGDVRRGLVDGVGQQTEVPALDSCLLQAGWNQQG